MYVSASLDIGQRPYDPELMDFARKYLGLPNKNSQNGCAGVALFAQSTAFAELINQLLCEIKGKIPLSRLTEQTIISAFALREGSFLPSSFMTMEHQLTSFWPSRSVFACYGRHYAAGWRPQFWIDSFFLRFLQK
jgi:hypothetical protein